MNGPEREPLLPVPLVATPATSPAPADAATVARFIRLEEAAERLSVSVKYLRAHRRDLRWIVELSPRVLRADEAAMLRWMERRKG